MGGGIHVFDDCCGCDLPYDSRDCEMEQQKENQRRGIEQ
jgi:hypothetical protein